MSYNNKSYLLIVIFISVLNYLSCFGLNCSNIKNDNSDDNIISYKQIISKMSKYENRYCSSEKERMAIYAMTFLQEGINSGKILKKELDKYTYIFEFKIYEDGRIMDVVIQNSEPKGSNDIFFIDYLKKLPQCEFWKEYSGKDKDSITVIFVPLRF